MSGPLDDLRIIDLSSGPAGGMATMVMADFGADVIKVEPPGGDPARAERAAPMWLRGKRSVTLDLEQAGDRAQLEALLRGADVVVSSAGPAEAVAARLDYDTLSQVNRTLVYCSITAWGPTGPYANYPADPALVAAKSGRMQAFSGISRRAGPAFPAVRTETHAAAQSALSGILAALLVRERTGEGQLVRTSMLQGMFPYDLATLVRAQLAERYPVHFQNDPYAALSVNSMPTLGYQPIMGKDGSWIQFANLLEHLFQASIIALDLTAEVLAEPKYAAAPRLAPTEAEEVRNLMLERARERTAKDWMPVFHENGNVAADDVGTAQTALHHADLVDNGEVIDLEHPKLGTVRQLGPLARLVGTPGSPSGYAPEAGEHTAAVLAEPARTPWQAPATASPRSARYPLEGVTVLEFATIIAVPYGASLLADLGARVIKVEPTGGGDPMRTLGIGLGAYLAASKMNAGKESICVDLKSEHGQALVGKLIEQADVIIHNYRPGVPERLGIGYERACSIKPDILHVSVNGYGPDGPSAHRPCAHPIPGAVCGGALMQVGSAWPPAIETLDDVREAARQFYRANEANPDPNTSVAVCSSVLLGLHARRRTGQGQQIFLSMLGANGYANHDDFLSYPGKAERPTLDAELHGTSALYRLYPAANDTWAFLAVHGEEQWQTFCRTAGCTEHAADARFATADARAANDAALAEALCAVIAQRSASDWEQTLIPAGIGCVEAVTQAPGEFFWKSEQMHANGFALEADHALWGRYQRWGPMVTFSSTPGRYGPGALAGEHTDALLAELGLSADEIATARASGVVDTASRFELGARVA